MPKKKKDSKVEERWVTWDDLDAGVKLKAGHPVILFLGGGAPGTPTGPGPSDPTGPEDPTAPGNPTGPDHTGSPGPGTTHHDDPGTAPPDPGHPTTTRNPNHPPTTTTRPDHPATTTTRPEHPATTTTRPQPATTTTARPHGAKIVALVAEHFATAKAFPLPIHEAIKAFKDIATLANQRPGTELLILGHTDRAGGDDYNFGLSEERARTAKAYLENDVDTWYAFYSHSSTQARWGMLEDQWMLQVATDATGASYYSRTPSAVVNADFKAGLKRFQTAKGLPSTGTTDKSTRQALILNYMQLEGTTVQDAQITSVGCGERCNKVPTADNVSNPDNRRVEIYAFEGGPITPPASSWKRSDPNPKQIAAWKAWHDTAQPLDGANDNLTPAESAEDP